MCSTGNSDSIFINALSICTEVNAVGLPVAVNSFNSLEKSQVDFKAELGGEE